MPENESINYRNFCDYRCYKPQYKYYKNCNFHIFILYITGISVFFPSSANALTVEILLHSLINFKVFTGQYPHNVSSLRLVYHIHCRTQPSGCAENGSSKLPNPTLSKPIIWNQSTIYPRFSQAYPSKKSTLICIDSHPLQLYN